MAIERKPLEQVEGPGYPDVKEYAAGRRTFLWLLGAGAVGVAGVYAWKTTRPAEPAAGLGTRTAGVPPNPNQPPAQPLVNTPGISAPQVTPAGGVAPQANPAGGRTAPVRPPDAQPNAFPDVKPSGALRPVEPPTRPQARLRGDVPSVEPPAKDTTPATPVVPPPGVPPPPKDPVPPKPQAAQPAARLLGEAAAPARPDLKPAAKDGVN
jgi:hypothetical protein